MINFLYGDDTVLLTNYIEELKELLSFFRVHSEGRGLFMGKKKTKLIILKNTTLLFCKIKLHKKIEKKMDILNTMEVFRHQIIEVNKI